MQLVCHTDFPSRVFPQRAALLSAAEMKYQERLKHPHRCEQWYNGRLLAKYLYLEYLTEGQEAASGICTHFSAEQLNRFSPTQYQDIELLPENGTGKKPFLYRAGLKQNTGVSLSYSDAYIAAVVSAHTCIGIDLEHITARRPEFYTHNFTQLEQQYVQQCSTDEQHTTWLYTLLWTIKEAALKATPDNSWTLWNLPAMEIDLRDSEQELLTLYHTPGQHSRFQASIKGPAGYAIAQLNCQQLNDQLLTTLYYEQYPITGNIALL